ncbi:MAG: Maf family protein, partial [Ignavibacteria bacterium]
KRILNQSYILASKSPRRAELLKQIGLNFIAVDSNIKELDEKYHDPSKLVKHNSLLKSRNISLDHKNEIIIGADTIVVLGKEILNKPENTSQAKEYLSKLSGKRHYVFTGVNIINTKNGKEIFFCEKTSVYFRKLNSEEINYYVKTSKPLDKAGAYGIQDDFGCLFIKKIEGDYYNIVGLPLVKLYENLLKMI